MLNKVGRFVGYDEESKGYRVYYPEKRWVGIERDVRFNPDEVLIPEGDIRSEGEWYLPATDPTINDNAETGTSDPVEDKNSNSENEDQPIQAESPESRNVPDKSDSEADEPAPVRLPDGLDPPLPNHERGMRSCPAAGHYTNLNTGRRTESASVAFLDEDHDYGDDKLHAFMAGLFVADSEFALPALSDTPTWKEAISGPHREEWLWAHNIKMSMIDKFKTYTVVPRPPNVNIIPSHLVPRIKHDTKGEINQFKVRLVAGGNHQIYGLDFTETFAWICRLGTHRIIFRITAQEDWEIQMINFKSAYLNTEPDQVTYNNL